MSGHSKHIGSSKNRVEARARSYQRAQALNLKNNKANEERHTTNLAKLADAGLSVTGFRGKEKHQNRPSRLLRKLARADKQEAYALAHPEAE